MNLRAALERILPPGILASAGGEEHEKVQNAVEQAASVRAQVRSWAAEVELAKRTSSRSQRQRRNP